MGELVTTLVAEGHEVLWIVAPIDLDHVEVMKSKTLGVKVVALPPPRPRYSRLAPIRHSIRQLWGLSQSLTKIVDQFQPEHIFLNQGGTWCGLQDEFWEVLKKYSHQYSLICHLNQDQHPFSPSILQRARELIDRSKSVFFASLWTRHLAERQIAQVIPQSLLFHYPVRFTFTAPLPWPKCTIPRFAMVSRFDTFHKGIDVALKAFAKLKQEGIQFRLTLYGSGEEEAYLQQLVQFEDLRDDVVFAGYTSKLEDVWRDQEMLILASRFEGLAVSMIEAMGFGRPVLRTKYGGADWIEHGVDGYLCAAAEPDLLYDTIRLALDQRSQWSKMGQLAHAKVVSNLDFHPARVFLHSLAI